MTYNVEALTTLVEQFMKIPSVGRKTAQRMAFHVLNISKQEAEDFAQAILDAHEKIKKCTICFNLSQDDVCSVCENSSRDRGIICVVEDPRDVIAIERTREFSGVYHVLHGVISPMNAIGPEQLTIKELISRTTDEKVKEVIMATNPTVEGDTTAMYIAKLLKPFEVRVTRLAYGIPVGADLEYADDVTLMRALEGRTAL
ncbi:MAG TPA: recombination mediator RecR [Oscillospiraceae bacterium]|nr:recombination mediator RecR [Oscillospiraceae bacterium]